MNMITTASPKSVQVANIIRNEIRTGNLKSEEKLLPSRKFAEKFTVSKQVIQTAFGILEKEGLIESHVGRGTFVASHKKSISLKTVVLILDGMGDKHERLHSLLPAEFQKNGYVSYIFDIITLKDGSNIENIKDILKEEPRALVVDAYSFFEFKILKWIQPKTQLIFVNRFEGSKNYKASYILEDYVAGGYSACKYLLKKGRTRIAMVSFERRPGWTSDLLTRGCEKALDESGLSLYGYFDFDNDNLPERFAEISDSLPDGFVCFNDHAYEQILKNMKKYKLVPGKDFDATGYGNTPWAKFFNIPSISPMAQEITERTVETVKSGMCVNVRIEPELCFPA